MIKRISKKAQKKSLNWNHNCAELLGKVAITENYGAYVKMLTTDNVLQCFRNEIK